MSTPKDAPYKIAQRLAERTRGEYLVSAGRPMPDAPYELRVRQVGDTYTGHQKIVRKEQA